MKQINNLPRQSLQPHSYIYKINSHMKYDGYSTSNRNHLLLLYSNLLISINHTEILANNSQLYYNALSPTKKL